MLQVKYQVDFDKEQRECRSSRGVEAYFSQMRRNVAAKREKWTVGRRDNSVDGQDAKIMYRLTNGELAKMYVDDVPEWAQIIVPE